jgi:hypothetical protein
MFIDYQYAELLETGWCNPFWYHLPLYHAIDHAMQCPHFKAEVGTLGLESLQEAIDAMHLT